MLRKFTDLGVELFIYGLFALLTLRVLTPAPSQCEILSSALPPLVPKQKNVAPFIPGCVDVVAKGILCVMKHGKTTGEVWVAAK